jgi:hypothetical protein
MKLRVVLILFLILVAVVVYDLLSNKKITKNLINLNISNNLPLFRDEYDFLKNEKNYYQYISQISKPGRQEILEYLEKNKYSPQSILAALAALSTKDHFESDLLYDGLRRHPHHPDLWSSLINYEKDDARLFDFLKINPPSKENAYITQLWLINHQAKNEKDIRTLLPMLNELAHTQQNLPSAYIKTKQAAYQLYLDLGYKNIDAKLMANNIDTTSISNPEASVFFIMELANRFNKETVSYIKKESALTEDEFSQLTYSHFLFRNSRYNSCELEIFEAVYMDGEISQLKTMDPNLEYGDTGITVSERIDHLKNEIKKKHANFDHYGAIIDDFMKNKLYNGNPQLHEKYLDINLNYAGQERIEQITKLAMESK